MNLLSLLTFGILGSKKTRDISSIVGVFTKAKTELEEAIKEHQAEIDAAEVAKAAADKDAKVAIKAATDKSDAKTKKIRKEADLKIAKAESESRIAKSKANAEHAEQMQNSINIINASRTEIETAREWLAQVPTLPAKD